MSHHSNSPDIPLFSIRSGIVFLASGAIIFLGIFSILEVLHEDQPHLRIGETDGRVSGLIVTDDTRLLILNTEDRAEARSFAGRMARPWEPDPSAVLVSAADYAASGLWEYLQVAEPNQVVIAGLPGSDVVWEAALDLCASRNISVDFVTHSSTISIEPFTVTVLSAKPGDPLSAAVVIRRDSANVFLRLDGDPANVQSQLTIGDSQLAIDNLSSVVIDVGEATTEFEGMRLGFDGSKVGRVYFDNDKIRIRDVGVLD